MTADADKGANMSHDNAHRDGLSRRQLLLAGGVLATAGCLSGINLRTALAEAQRLGKPIFTDDAFTARLASVRQSPAFRAEIEEIKRSLPSYLESRYLLNDRQRQLVAQLTREEILRLNANLDRALQQNLAVRLQMEGPCQKRLRLEYQLTQAELVIVVVT
jgi:hypothetical protein